MPSRFNYRESVRISKFSILTTLRMVYPELFPGPLFRRSIENYIVEANASYMVFKPCKQGSPRVA
jgi:hypothetical protein